MEEPGARASPAREEPRRKETDRDVDTLRRARRDPDPVRGRVQVQEFPIAETPVAPGAGHQIQNGHKIGVLRVGSFETVRNYAARGSAAESVRAEAAFSQEVLLKTTNGAALPGGASHDLHP